MPRNDFESQYAKKGLLTIKKDYLAIPGLQSTWSWIVVAKSYNLESSLGKEPTKKMYKVKCNITYFDNFCRSLIRTKTIYCKRKTLILRSWAPYENELLRTHNKMYIHSHHPYLNKWWYWWYMCNEWVELYFSRTTRI